MAKPKKGALHQILVPMVDSTDFASVESAITESDFNSGATKKFYGVNTGSSAATTSGTISKTASLVRSGVFRITLKTTENNYDGMMVRISKTGCAEQIFVWSNVDNDDSDLMSQILLGTSAASDAASAAQQANSRILLVQSRLSDLNSTLNSDLSDILSQLTVVQSMASDAASAAQQGASRALINQSRLSDIQSFLSNFESDLISHIDTTGVGLNASTMSDLRSAIDAGPAATVTASDISDIASAVRAILISDLSDIHSAATAGASRALINQSRISDLQSYVVLISDAISDAHSDLASKIGGITASVSASDISDIASAVKATLASDISDIHSAATAAASRATLIQSQLSDVESQIDAGVELGASTLSDLRSAITAAEFDASDVSDIGSRIVTVLASDLSDILSAATAAASRALVNQSRVSDIQSLLTLVASNVSDIESQIDAGVEIGASSLSDLRSAITAAGLDAAGADPTDVVGVTASTRAKVDWLTALSRNKVTQTSTVQNVFQDDGSTKVASAAVSDDGTTYSRGEFA